MINKNVVLFTNNKLDLYNQLTTPLNSIYIFYKVSSRP